MDDKKTPERLTKDEYHKTFEEIAQELGVTPQRAVQIAKSAYAKVKRALAARGIDIKDVL